MTLNEEEEPPRSTHPEILEEEHAKEDHGVHVLLKVQDADSYPINASHCVLDRFLTTRST